MSDAPVDPPPITAAKAVLSAILIPALLLLLIFLPAGDLWWRPGWIFVGVLVAAFIAAMLVLARVNPVIFRARSRFQPGTERWDLALLAVLLPAMVAILPVAALDAGRFGWSDAPDWIRLPGYALLVASIGIQTWAQGVNPFFEPGVRIQAERHQRVIDTGPYRQVRHPGYSSALMMFAGMSLALGSYWGLVPALIASALLALRTAWEDRLLHQGLPGYPEYARKTRYRLIPGIW